MRDELKAAQRDRRGLIPHPSSLIPFLKGWRNTILGALVVLSGVSAAVITVVARRGGDWELTRLGAIASLLFGALVPSRPRRLGALPRPHLLGRPRARHRHRPQHEAAAALLLRRGRGAQPR